MEEFARARKAEREKDRNKRARERNERRAKLLLDSWNKVSLSSPPPPPTLNEVA